ncbi:MAG TPA: ABC transporter permease [Streptosporangiaceae bacterium]
MNSVAGLGILTRLALRRDRILIAVWAYAFTAVAYASVDATRKLYPTPGSRLAFAAGAGSNKATIAMYGPPGDLHTLGGLALWKLNAWGAVLVAIMSMVIVNRHTRGDEEAGRLELTGAGAVGRNAALTAGLLTAVLANLIVALLVAIGLGFAHLPGPGAVAFGLGLAGAGCVFAALTALVAQAAASARSTTGIVAGLLAVAYLLRAVGDTAAHGGWLASLSWLSPIGWAEQIRPFGPLHWWPLAILVLFAAVVVAAAYRLSAGRDLGAGLLPVRPGPARAAASLAGAFGLAWRLQRGSLLAWTSAFALGGLLLGAVAGSVGSLVGDSHAAREMFTKLGGHAGLTDAYLASVMATLGLLASVYAVQAALRLRGEEAGQRAEPVLAAATGRIRWAASHLVFAAAGPAILLAVAGLAAGLTYGAGTGDLGGTVARLAGSGLAQVPAAWVAGGITAALFGVAPRLAVAAWGILVAFLFLGQFGSLLGLSQWAMNLSPFTHVPKLPGASFTAVPLLWLALTAALLTAAGLAGLRRRDLA